MQSAQSKNICDPQSVFWDDCLLCLESRRDGDMASIVSATQRDVASNVSWVMRLVSNNFLFNTLFACFKTIKSVK